MAITGKRHRWWHVSVPRWAPGWIKRRHTLHDATPYASLNSQLSALEASFPYPTTQLLMYRDNAVSMRVKIVNTVRVAGTLDAADENLSPIDASPLLLKTLNSPSLKFKHSLSLDKLHQATAALLQEYPIIAGRLKKAPKKQIAKHPYLKAAPYCIDITAHNGGVVLCEAETDAAADDIQLNQALSASFGMTPGKVLLPPWYQPLDVSAMLHGKEPLLKLQLTHCTDGGCILAATMPHLLADSHSSTLLLIRLSELYRQLIDKQNCITAPPPTAAAVPVAATTERNGTAASAETAGVDSDDCNPQRRNSSNITGVAYQHMSLLRVSSKGHLPSAKSATAPLPQTASSTFTRDTLESLCTVDSSQGSITGITFDRILLKSSSFGKNTCSTLHQGSKAAVLQHATAAEAPAPAGDDVLSSSNSYAGSTAVTASKGSKPWSKALLLPRVSKDVPPPKVLKSLSLDLQSVDKPSLGKAVGWLGAAVKEGISASKTFPKATSTLTSCLLNIPQLDLVQLKALATGGDVRTSARRISTNDALSALVWILYCDLRGRPLPGGASSSSGGSSTSSGSRRSIGGLFSCSTPRAVEPAPVQQPAAAAAVGGAGTGHRGGALGMAIDLRQNCPDLKHLPGNYFGNAAWCLHIVSPGESTAATSSSSSTEVQHSRSASAAASRGYQPLSEGQAGSSRYAAALQAAAGVVRGALMEFRQSRGAGNMLLQLIAAQQAAPTAVMVRNLSRLAVRVDAFITSWQFLVHQIDFGSGTAAEYCCVVRPTPPWQAAVLPSKPCEGGAQLLLTVPASAVEALKKSPVLQQLVPHATLG